MKNDEKKDLSLDSANPFSWFADFAYVAERRLKPKPPSTNSERDSDGTTVVQHMGMRILYP